MHKPRLLIVTSLMICGKPSPSMVGISAGITRSTMPTLPCCKKALTRKRPTPPGEMAKLHSLVRSNSAVCLSFMIERASAMVCALDSGWGDTLVMRPSTLMAGGNSAVMNRSLPLRLISSLSRSLMNLLACSRSMVVGPRCQGRPGRQPGKFSGILALLRASAGVMMLRRTRSVRHWSSVCMPTPLPV